MNILVARSGRYIWQRPLPRLSHLKFDLPFWPRHQASSTAGDSGPDIKKTRNIGIIAHIDAVGQRLFSKIIAWITKQRLRAKQRQRSVCSIIVDTLGELEVTTRSPIQTIIFSEF
jgi:hypothetical protein